MSGEHFVNPRSSRRKEAHSKLDRGSVTRSNLRQPAATSRTQTFVRTARRAKRLGLRRLDPAFSLA